MRRALPAKSLTTTVPSAVTTAKTSAFVQEPSWRTWRVADSTTARVGGPGSCGSLGILRYGRSRWAAPAGPGAIMPRRFGGKARTMLAHGRSGRERGTAGDDMTPLTRDELARLPKKLLSAGRNRTKADAILVERGGDRVVAKDFRERGALVRGT